MNQPDDQLPREFGKYHLIERVAMGGMAEMYRAKLYGAGGFEKNLAVKKILPHLGRDEAFIQMFMDEAMITVTLNHGNIAQVLDFGEVDGDYFIVMEYVDGIDLQSLIKRSAESYEPIPVDLAAYIVQETCRGLDYAHNKLGPDGNSLQIVHRDVSPQNVLISFEGQVKLVDFGIARAASRITSTQAGVVKGKVAYMSPEQMTGQMVDSRADVFSAGIILYELLTHQRPFDGATPHETMAQISRGSYKPPSKLNRQVNRKLAGVVKKALEKSIKKRYPTAGKMSAALANYLHSTGEPPTPLDLAQLVRERLPEAKPRTIQPTPIRAMRQEITPSGLSDPNRATDPGASEVRAGTPPPQQNTSQTQAGTPPPQTGTPPPQTGTPPPQQNTPQAPTSSPPAPNAEVSGEISSPGFTAAAPIRPEARPRRTTAPEFAKAGANSAPPRQVDVSADNPVVVGDDGEAVSFGVLDLPGDYASDDEDKTIIDEAPARGAIDAQKSPTSQPIPAKAEPGRIVNAAALPDKADPDLLSAATQLLTQTDAGTRFPGEAKPEPSQAPDQGPSLTAKTKLLNRDDLMDEAPAAPKPAADSKPLETSDQFKAWMDEEPPKEKEPDFDDEPPRRPKKGGNGAAIAIVIGLVLVAAAGVFLFLDPLGLNLFGTDAARTGAPGPATNLAGMQPVAPPADPPVDPPVDPSLDKPSDAALAMKDPSLVGKRTDPPADPPKDSVDAGPVASVPDPSADKPEIKPVDPPADKPEVKPDPLAVVKVKDPPVKPPKRKKLKRRVIARKKLRKKTHKKPDPVVAVVKGEGTLRINSEPFSVVFWKKKRIGPTPQMNVKLPAGSHTLLLTNEALGLSKRVRVRIEPDKVHTIFVELNN